MSKTRPWREIRGDIRVNPERAARIDAIKREMDRQIEVASIATSPCPPPRPAAADRRPELIGSRVFGPIKVAADAIGSVSAAFKRSAVHVFAQHAPRGSTVHRSRNAGKAMPATRHGKDVKRRKK